MSLDPCSHPGGLCASRHDCQVQFDRLRAAFRQRQAGASAEQLCYEYQDRLTAWTAQFKDPSLDGPCLDARLRDLPDLQDLVSRLLYILKHSIGDCATICQSSVIPGLPAVGDCGGTQGGSKSRGPLLGAGWLQAIDDALARLEDLAVTIHQDLGRLAAKGARWFRTRHHLGPFRRLCATAVGSLYPSTDTPLRAFLAGSMTDMLTRMFYARALFVNSRPRGHTGVKGRSGRQFLGKKKVGSPPVLRLRDRGPGPEQGHRPGGETPYKEKYPPRVLYSSSEEPRVPIGSHVHDTLKFRGDVSQHVEADTRVHESTANPIETRTDNDQGGREKIKSHDEAGAAMLGDPVPLARLSAPTSRSPPRSNQVAQQDTNITVIPEDPSALQAGQGVPYGHPMPNEDDGYTPCQWCATRLSKTMPRDEWNTHMSKHLKPYICLWGSCPDTAGIFETFAEWSTHMRRHSPSWHRRVFPAQGWLCAVCMDFHSDSQALLSHLDEVHSDVFAPETRAVIAQNSVRERLRGADECPLCPFEVTGPWEGDRRNKRPRLSSQREEHAGFPSEAMEQHIGEHLLFLMNLTIRLANVREVRDEADVDDVAGSCSHSCSRHAQGGRGSRGSLGTVSDLAWKLAEDTPVPDADPGLFNGEPWGRNGSHETWKSEL